MTAVRSDEGFALVESICALFVSTLVVVALALAGGLVVRFSAAVARQTNETEVLTSGLSALRRDLSGALAIPADEEPKSAVLFQGSSGAIGFATKDEIIWIEAAAKDGTGVLMRSARPVPPGIRTLGAPERRDAATLVSGPWRFRFSFAAFEDAHAAWTHEWTGRERLPDLVRLEVFGADETARPALSVSLSPRMRQARHCTFDDPPSCLSPAVAEVLP